MAEAGQDSTEDLGSLTGEQLVTYLQKQGIEGDDLAKIEDGGYNGKTILLLAEDNKQRLYKLKLSDSSIAVLEDLFEKLTPKEDPSSEQTVPPDELQPTSSHEILSSFGLGYGIDASDDESLTHRHGEVRLVLPNLSNVEERTINRRDTYEQQIATVKSHQESVNLSVSDITGTAINISAEAAYSREKTQELTARGEKVVTRSIKFKPFYSKDYQKEGGAPTDTSIEDEVVKWITEKIPDAKSAPGSTAAEKVENYLQDSPEDFNLAVNGAYLFVKTEKLTHYIEAIDLGAAKYSLEISSTSKLTASAGLEANVQKTGGGGAKAKRTVESSNKTKEDQTIGDINTVSRNNGEEVVGVNIMPIFALLTHGTIKKVLQKAIIFYLNRENGPFVISCGENNNKYLHIVEIAHKKQVLGIEGREKASFFYIFTKEPSREFNIAYYGRQEDDRYTESGLYLSANTRFGHDSGPLEVGDRDATEFVLSHPSKDDESLTIEYWETDGCYVRLAPRTFQLKSYMAFDEEKLKTLCVGSLKHEEKDNIWLRFQLRRVRYESSTRITAYGSSNKSVTKDNKTEPSAKTEEQTEADDASKEPEGEDHEAFREEKEVRGSIVFKSNQDDEVSDGEDA